MKTTRSSLRGSIADAGGYRKTAANQIAPARGAMKPQGPAGLNRLMRSMDARLDRAESQIDAVLARQASKKT